MAAELERGQASLWIELHESTITVRHGTALVVLERFEGVKAGTWEKLFYAILEAARQGETV